MIDIPKPDYEYITTKSKVDGAIDFLLQHPSYAIDTETSGLDPYTDKVMLVQVGVPGKAFVFDVRNDTEHSEVPIKDLLPIFTSDKLKLLHNSVFDMKMIKIHAGVYLRNIYDTMLAEQLLNLGLPIRARLVDIVRHYLGMDMPKDDQSSFGNYTQTFKDHQLTYAANDVLLLHDIMHLQIERIKKHKLEEVCQLEFDFTIPMCEMELNGIVLDIEKWGKVMGYVQEGLVHTRQEVCDLLNTVSAQTTLFGVSSINIDSTKQLKKALNDYGIAIESTNVAVLSKYEGVPLIDSLLDYRKAQKLISTYSDGMIDKVHPVTKRLHTSFQQMVSTGRMSSAKPNLQNIPKKQIYRSCFVARPGYKLITCDMSSAELRILGNYSMDPIFLECLNEGKDLHTRSASEVYSVPMDKVDKVMRNACKAISFGLMYGLSKFGLSRRLSITEDQAQELIDKYFGVFKRVKEYLDKAAKDGISNKCSLSISGRKRFYNIPSYDDPRRKEVVSGVKRQSMNAPIQGCLVADSNIKGIGRIGNQVGNRLSIETGFGRDTATCVYSGKKEVYDLLLANGVTLGITLDHKVPVINGASIEDKPVSKLDFENDRLYIPLNKVEGVSNSFLTKSLAFDIGCALAKSDSITNIPNYIYTETIEHKQALFDGLVSVSGLTFKSKELASDVQQLLFSLGIASTLENATITMHAKHDNSFEFCKIVSLNYRGIEDTYDLICDNIHYFTANGVIVHNSNADTIKKSMIYLVDRLEKLKYDAKLILTVHDEVIVECHESQTVEVSKLVAQCLIDGFGYFFKVIPMEAEALVGPCWLKDPCERKDDSGNKCGCREMALAPDERYGTKIICSKCGGDI